MSCRYLRKLKGYKVKGRSWMGLGGGYSWTSYLEMKGILQKKREKKQSLENAIAQKINKQFFFLSNGLSKHSSIVDAKPVTSFTQALYPVIQCDICTLCYVNVCRCVRACRYLMHVYSLPALFLDRSELIWCLPWE